MTLAAGCSSPPQSADARPPVTSARAVAPSSAAPVVAASPDETLQERLRAAVRDIEATRAASRPIVLGVGPKAEPAGPGSQAPWGATPTPPPPPAPGSTATPQDAADRWPIVEIGDSKILLDGVVVGSAMSIVDTNRLVTIDELFQTLNRARERWKAAHPDKPFPGVAGVRARVDAPQLVRSSVYKTMALAGWPDILVQSAEEPTAISPFSLR